jgi:hypothetical protein
VSISSPLLAFKADPSLRSSEREVRASKRHSLQCNIY